MSCFYTFRSKIGADNHRDLFHMSMQVLNKCCAVFLEIGLFPIPAQSTLTQHSGDQMN